MVPDEVKALKKDAKNGSFVAVLRLEAEMTAQGETQQAEYWRQRAAAFLEGCEGIFRGSSLAEAHEFDATLLPEEWRATASVLAYLGAGDEDSPIARDVYRYLDQLPKITEQEPDGFEVVLGIDHDAVHGAIWDGLKDEVGLRGGTTPDGVVIDDDAVKRDVVEDYLRAQADILVSIQ